MATQNILNVTVRARDGVKYQGQAISVSGVNQKGVFDVLPHHSNFICTIEKKLTVRPPTGQIQEFSVENGVLHVSDNQILAYLSVK